jgi:[ribosomal protein S5]-alanine N-acetyltransferase
MNYKLKTERLRLRLMELSDAPSIFEGYASDPVASRYMAFPTATNIVETIAFLQAQRIRFEAGRSFLWAILDRKNGAFIGAIEIIRIDDEEAEVGFIISKPYWGRGIVPEALRAVLAFSKEELRLQRVRGRCDVENSRSARVFEKTGFRSLGVARSPILHPNVSAEMRECRMFALEL